MSLVDAKYAMSGLRGVPESVVELLRTFREGVRQIEDDRRWSDEQKAKMLDELRREATSALDALGQTVGTYRRMLDDAVEGTLARSGAESSDPVMRLVAEVRRDRAWSRAARLLDAGVSPEQVARVAAEARDGEVLAALREELPMFLQATHRDMPRQHAEQIIAGTLAEVEQAALPLLPADQREAMDLRDSAGKLNSIVDLNLSSVRGEFDGTRPASMLVTADGATINVDEVVPA